MTHKCPSPNCCHNHKASFGKYKGQFYEELPTSYLEWLFTEVCIKGNFAYLSREHSRELRRVLKTRGSELPEIEIEKSAARVAEYWAKKAEKQAALMRISRRTV